MRDRIILKVVFTLLLLLPIVDKTLRAIIFGLIIIFGIITLINIYKNNRFSKETNNISSKKILAASIVIAAYAIINTVINGVNLIVLERIVQLVACLVVLLLAAEHNWSKSDCKYCINSIRIILFICLVLFVISGFNPDRFSSLYSSTNSFGGILFCYAALYMLIPRKYTIIDIVTIFLCISFMIVANSRASECAFILFAITSYIFSKKRTTPKKTLFIIAIAACLVIPTLYIASYDNLQIRRTLNDFSRDHFEKNFYSGRQEIWSLLIYKIKQKSLIGYGLNVTPSSLIGLDLSAHNWYLQTLLQIGIIGLALMLNVLREIWNAVTKNKKNIVALKTAAFILGVLLWQCFEVTLTQNNTSIGIIAWFIMGIGLNARLFEISLGDNSQINNIVQKKEKMLS